MAYILDLFTPETWEAFCDRGATVTGFRVRQEKLARERVSPGDLFVCYLTRLSRWCGVVRAESEAYIDDSPLLEDPDPFVVRFKVTPLVKLPAELAIPIQDDRVWNELTITKEYKRGYRFWTGFFRSSLGLIKREDGDFLLDLLKSQQTEQVRYPLTEKDKRELAKIRKIRSIDRQVDVEVPDDEEVEANLESELHARPRPSDSRDSIRYQAKVAQIGVEMGFRIWVPRDNKAAVLQHVPESIHGEFLSQLPLNYDDTTLRTVEQIDVLWLKGRSMSRAFEIEHTTAIYSGLLRMADLLALQPNMDIRLHIVAPPDKRERVLSEIRRPVFSLLDRGPLYEQCSFLSYNSIDALGETQHLSHMSDTILAEYEELAEV